jgi:hypothetical protein
MQHTVLILFGTALILLLAPQGGNSEGSSSSTPGRNRFWGGRLFARKHWGKGKRTYEEENDSARNKSANEEDTNMGQAVRIVKYDRAENEKNAIPALNLLDQPLKWHRLDDGVMGGQSETLHMCTDDGSLHFKGEINTNGGGFCSIRSPFGGFPPDTKAVRLRFKGDGKTYKLLLSDGTKSAFGPSRRSPSWQSDIPTKGGEDEEELILPLSSLKPSFGGSAVGAQEPFDASSMGQIGFMLSLKLSDGSSNPIETFGSGIFPFSFTISSIEPIGPN